MIFIYQRWTLWAGLHVLPEKMTDNNVELFELYSCVSFAIGCSWDAVDIFRDISVLYKRKGLFEYQSECPENIIPDTD